MQSDGSQAVLVTGASSGIGLDCAKTLAQKGIPVLAGVRQEKDRQKLNALGLAALTPVMLDVTQEETITQAVDQIQASGIPLGGLVNNAGIVIAGPLECLTTADLREQLEVNVIGQLAVTRHCLPLLRETAGRIVNMGSISGLTASPFIGPYCASKHALEALTDSLRMELKPWGIQVAIIEPGSIDTPIWERSTKCVEEKSQHWPPHAQQLYGQAMEKMRHTTARSAANALPVSQVTDAVWHALTAKRSKARYLIGQSAKIRAFLRWLPTSLQDRLVLAYMGLPQDRSNPA